MSRFPFGPFAFTRLDKQLEDDPEWKAAKAANPDVDPLGQSANQPHIECTYHLTPILCLSSPYFWLKDFSTELYGGGPQHPHLPTLPTDSAFAMITMLCSPNSRGTVRLSSSSPTAKPIIDHAYLSDPLDVSALAAGTALAHDIALEGAGTKEHIAGAWPVGRISPNGRDKWKEYVRQQAGTCYHPAGTCKMAPDSDPEGVVDPRLRVRGVKGLRVAGKL
jgi:choline dehydrogenase-like flavoprotein